MPGPLLLDLSHTSHTRARTGIQRVARSLHAALGDRVVAITHDPWEGTWRRLEGWEEGNLAADHSASRRGARWPFLARWRGRLRRRLRAAPGLPENSGLIVPEVFSPRTAAALPALFARTTGPRVAIFHDAIPLSHPEHTPARTVARFPDYLAELRAFDGIAAVSGESRLALENHWRATGTGGPPVGTIPLGVDPPRPPPTPGRGTGNTLPVVLSVGSIEGRKNHLALLEACAQLWQEGERFTLHLIGLANRETGAAALARIRALQSAGRPIRYDGPVGEAALQSAYAQCDFTIYPSIAEGFGLPVIESLVHGKPCICSARGALGESAQGGGCVTVAEVGAGHLAAALAALLRDPARRAALAAEARQRRFKTWADYAGELTAWMESLPPRDARQ
jgi:glycosyltransferase involved in cell wall biosynthesis